MADLSTLTYGTVQGRFMAIVGDTADGGVYPDAEPMVGTVTITPSITHALVGGASPVPATVLIRPMVIPLNASGYMEWNGSTITTLVATDSIYVNPSGWTYTASFDLTHNGEPVPYAPFSFQVPAGTAVDLTTVAPISSSGGVLTIQGPVGPQGAPGPAGATSVSGFTFSTTATWRAPMRQNNGTFTPTIGTLYLWPIYLSRAVTLDGLAVLYTAAGSADSNVYVAIYDDLNFMPNNKIKSTSAISVSTSGIKSETFADVALAQGVYWVGMLMTGTTASAIELANDAFGLFESLGAGTAAAPSAATGNDTRQYTQTGQTSPPATFTLTSRTTGNNRPFVWMRLR